MIDDARFLAAVIADPDSDAPRLVYADWLDERGDPRGAFIRTQCSLAVIESNDLRRARLELESRQLLAQHGENWLASVREILEGDRRWSFGSLFGAAPTPVLLHHEFRRGFVEVLLLDALAYLAHHEALHAATPVTDLRLQLSREAVIANVLESLAACPSLQQVRTLHIAALRVLHGQLPVLFGSPNLAQVRALNFYCPDLDVTSVEALVDSELLEQLCGLKLTGAGRVGPAGVGLLANSPRSRGLRSLALNIIGLTAESMPALLGTSHLAGLTELDLSHNPLGNAALPFIIDYAPAGLQRLDLSNARIGDSAVELLAGSPLLRRLRRLKLDMNPIHDRGIQALADSPHLIGDTRVSVTNDRRRITPAVWEAARFRLGHRLVEALGEP